MWADLVPRDEKSFVLCKGQCFVPSACDDKNRRERERERANERDCILFCNHSKSSRSSQALDRQSQVEEKEPQYHHEIVSEPVRT